MNVFDETIAEATLAQQIVNSLSERELECFVLLAKGLTTKHLALKLNVAYKTAATHRGRIMQKLNIHTGQELAVLGWRTRSWLSGGLVIKQRPRAREHKELNKLN